MPSHSKFVPYQVFARDELGRGFIIDPTLETVFPGIFEGDPGYPLQKVDSARLDADLKSADQAAFQSEISKRTNCLFAHEWSRSMPFSA
jgi:hypothetical protein